MYLHDLSLTVSMYSLTSLNNYLTSCYVIPSLLPKISPWQPSVSRKKDWNVRMYVWKKPQTEGGSYIHTYTHMYMSAHFLQMWEVLHKGSIQRSHHKASKSLYTHTYTHIHILFFFPTDNGRVIYTATQRGLSKAPGCFIYHIHTHKLGFFPYGYWGVSWSRYTYGSSYTYTRMHNSYFLQVWYVFHEAPQRGTLLTPMGFIDTYAQCCLFSYTYGGMLYKALIQKGLCKALWLHTYIHTHILLFFIIIIIIIITLLLLLITYIALIEFYTMLWYAYLLQSFTKI